MYPDMPWNTTSVPSPDHVTAPVPFQMCHVVLGLRPRSRQEEADIVLGWLCRQESLGYRVGALWYLVNMAWWNAWTDYVNYQVRVVMWSLWGWGGVGGVE